MITPCVSLGSVNLGARVRCIGDLKSIDSGELVDSNDVYFWIINPLKEKTIYHYGVDTGLVRLAQGEYYFDVDASIKGEWFYGFYSTGTAQAASIDGRFRVRGSIRTRY